jgi:hypothetical protein
MYCIQCEYKAIDGKYKSSKHKSRNSAELISLCKVAEQGIEKVYSNEETTIKEKDAIAKLKVYGVFPSVHPFHSVPMGYNNSLYKTPYDLLHTFPGGIMKSLAHTVMVIV